MLKWWLTGLGSLMVVAVFVAQKWRPVLGTTADAPQQIAPASLNPPPLTSQQAYNLITPWFESVCDIIIPIGEQNLMLLQVADGGENHEFALNALALKEIGVIKWIDLPSMLGMAHFRLELADTAYGTQIINYPALKCIRNNASPYEVKIVSVANVKGGQTNWDGALVLASSQFQPTELYKRYKIARKSPIVTDQRIRMLARYDIFSKGWKFQAMDMGPLNGDFITQRVPAGLGKD